MKKFVLALAILCGAVLAAGAQTGHNRYVLKGAIGDYPITMFLNLPIPDVGLQIGTYSYNKKPESVFALLVEYKEVESVDGVEKTYILNLEEYSPHGNFSGHYYGELDVLTSGLIYSGVFENKKGKIFDFYLTSNDSPVSHSAAAPRQGGDINLTGALYSSNDSYDILMNLTSATSIYGGQIVYGQYRYASKSPDKYLTVSGEPNAAGGYVIYTDNGKEVFLLVPSQGGYYGEWYLYNNEAERDADPNRIHPKKHLHVRLNAQ